MLCGWDDGWLNCLSAKGEVLWRFFGDRFRVGGICVGDADGDGVSEIIYGTDDGHVYCLAPTGLVKWRYYEEAPYGRSGPNLADLNGDGKREVVITRSNVGNATCLIALDAATGAFLWRTRDAMQGYVSNAIVDLEGDGKNEVIHADKGNFVYCENADGSRRWQVELGGRGIFWAPAVADIDGDGHLEILATTRDSDPKDKANAFVVSDDGKVKARLCSGQRRQRWAGGRRYRRRWQAGSDPRRGRPQRNPSADVECHGQGRMAVVARRLRDDGRYPSPGQGVRRHGGGAADARTRSRSSRDCRIGHGHIRADTGRVGRQHVEGDVE